MRTCDKHVVKMTLLVMVLTVMSACGVKPGNVEGKEGFPHPYPDITTDPVPSGRGADHF